MSWKTLKKISEREASIELRMIEFSKVYGG